jgi:hypothetical protein
MASVIQDWVMGLPLRQQGVLLLALRGPDGSRKESPSKPILRTLRGCVLNAGRYGRPLELGEVMEGDSFMRMDLIAGASGRTWVDVTHDFYTTIDEQNVHFLQHLLHAAAVLGFGHRIEIVRERWLSFYHTGVHKLHMNPETKEQFTHRLRDGRRAEEDE